MDVAFTADGAVVGGGRLPHEWPALWTPNSAASLRGRGWAPSSGVRRLRPLVPFSGEIERLVIESDGGAAFVNLAHQFETAFGNQ